jgi:hypothetical protein
MVFCAINKLEIKHKNKIKIVACGLWLLPKFDEF